MDPVVVKLIHMRTSEDYLAAIRSHLHSWFRDLFLRKLVDWESENEFRWIYFDDNPGPVFVNFADALEAIVVGAGVPQSQYEDVLRCCVRYRADVANLNWHNGYPKVDHCGQPYITHKHLLSGI